MEANGQGWTVLFLKGHPKVRGQTDRPRRRQNLIARYFGVLIVVLPLSNSRP